MMAENRTFTMLKPDAVEKGHIGAILDQINASGFRIVAMKLTQMTRTDAEKFYEIHKERPFFGELVEFITSGPVFAMVWEGENVILTARQMMGATNPKDAAPGTIRGDFAVTVGKNMIHGSDSAESAEREIGLFFKEEELVSYEKTINNWVN